MTLSKKAQGIVAGIVVLWLLAIAGLVAATAMAQAGDNSTASTAGSLERNVKGVEGMGLNATAFASPISMGRNTSQPESSVLEKPLRASLRTSASRPPSWKRLNLAPRESLRESAMSHWPNRTVRLIMTRLIPPRLSSASPQWWACLIPVPCCH